MRQRWIISLVMILTLISGLLTPVIPAVRPADAAIASLHSFFFSGNRPGSGFQLSYVQINRTVTLNAVSQITLEAWVKRVDATRNETVVCNNHEFSYCLGFSGGHVFFTTAGNSTQILSAANVPAGAWTHIAATYDGAFSRIFINGIQDTISADSLGMEGTNIGFMGIGADLSTDYIQNYFEGWIDNVRIWDAAQDGSSIRALMFMELGHWGPDLLAEWRLNGDATDSAGSNNGSDVGPHYVPDGALPTTLFAPFVASAPTLDGSCGASTEYNDAIQVAASSSLPPGTSIYLENTSTDLWVCFDNLTTPTWMGDNWAAVYLDPNFSRDPFAQTDDFSLELHHDLSRHTRIGDGSGNYTATSAFDSQWDGTYSSFFDGFFWHNSAEFRISNGLTGITAQGGVFGLAVAQQGIGGTGDDRFWPALSFFNNPSTWGELVLLGNGPARTFSGNVNYVTSGSQTATGIPGVTVNLIGSEPNSTQAIVGTAKTLSDGSFSLTSNDGFFDHRLAVDPNTFPKGYTPKSASAPPPGQIFSNIVIDYGSAGGGSYPSNLFTITDIRPEPVDQSNAPFFMIVAPATVINNGALNDFVDYKRRVGFQVEVDSIQFAVSSFPGASTLEHIRNLEKNRYNTYGTRFRYVMLVGTNDTLPFGRINAGAVFASDCHNDPGWPTDWFYADLTSNWDTNGNGCWGDGIFGDHSVQQGHGYSADSINVYNLTVALGRLPYDDPGVIHNVLQNSMAFENSSSDVKRLALLSMSMTDLHGQCWDSKNSQYISCNSGTDGSFLGEALFKNILTPNRILPIRLYENQPVSVGGVPTGASGLMTAQRDTYADVHSVLKTNHFGLAGLFGHGDPWEVVRTFWGGDLNGNGLIDSPTAPFPPNNQSVDEINQPTMFNVWSPVTQPNLEPVFLIAACSTGEYNVSNSLGADLLHWALGTAWVGGTATLPYSGGWQSPGQGGMQDTTYNIARLLISFNQRLGDAVWQTMQTYMTNIKPHPEWGWWAQDYDLYGDPTLSYWGDPGGQSTLSPWPMLRQDAYGHGATTLMGPATPGTAWTYPALARLLDTLPPSPVVAWNGDVVLAHGNFIDVVRNGVQLTRLTLNAPDYGSPAIAADGTIYALDRGGILYAFACGSGPGCNYSLHWSMDLVGLPLTSPVIGPDGLVTVAHEGADASSSYISLVRSDGQLFFDQLIPGQAVGELAVGGDGIVYATTTSGALVRFDSNCPIFQCIRTDGVTGGPAYTTPPLLYQNTIFAGKADGTVVRKNGDTLATQFSFTANGAITSGPIVTPGGTIVVGTDAGTLYDLSGGLFNRWHVDLGAPLASEPAASASDVYIASGNFLYAYEPFSGSLDWHAFLGAGANGGSAAVGYGRQVFVQTRNGPLVDIAENWSPPSPLLKAHPRLRIDPASGSSTSTMTLEWLPPIPIIPIGSPTVFNPLGYQIQRRASGSDWQDLVFLPYDSTSFDDDSVQPGMLYDYRIQVLDAQGNDSDYTILAAALQSLPLPPAAAALSPITPLSASSLQLNWASGAAGGNPDGYRVQRGPSPIGPFTTIVTQTATTVYTDTALLPNSAYDYRVIAFNGAGDSAPSNVQEGTTFQQTLPAPQNVQATLLNKYTVQISWDAGPAGATAVVEVSSLGEAVFHVLGSASNTGPFIDVEIDPNSYTYRVKFVMGANESPYSLATLRVSTAGFLLTPRSVYLPVIGR